MLMFFFIFIIILHIRYYKKSRLSYLFPHFLCAISACSLSKQRSHYYNVHAIIDIICIYAVFLLFLVP